MTPRERARRYLLSEFPKGIQDDLDRCVSGNKGKGEAGRRRMHDEIVAVYRLHLRNAGWSAEIAALRGETHARLAVVLAAEKAKRIFEPARLSVQARRARRIAGDIRRLCNLKQNAAVTRLVNRVIKEMHQISEEMDRLCPALGASGVQTAVKMFGLLHSPMEQAAPPDEMKRVAGLLCEFFAARPLDVFANKSAELAEAVSGPLQSGRGPRTNRVFNLVIELLAQSYFRDTGKVAQEEVYELKGRPRGEFLDIVDQATKGSGRRSGAKGTPAGRRALAKRIKRVLDRSPRVPAPP